MRIHLIQFFNWVFICLSVVMMLFSAIALYAICSETFKYNFGFESKNILFFFSFFKSYTPIFTAFLGSLGVLLVIRRLEEQSVANKLNIRKEWLSNLSEVMITMKDDNPRMHNYVLKIVAFDIFESIYHRSMRVNNKKRLTSVFNKYIKDKIVNFEKTSKKYNEKNPYFGNVESYSYQSFNSFILDILRPTFKYEPALQSDFKKLYMAEVELYKATL